MFCPMFWQTIKRRKHVRTNDPIMADGQKCSEPAVQMLKCLQNAPNSPVVPLPYFSLKCQEDAPSQTDHDRLTTQKPARSSRNVARWIS